MSELKAGGTAEFTVAGQTLVLEPIPYGQLKKILRLVLDVSKEAAEGKLTFIPDALDKYFPEIIPLLFIKNKYPFINAVWIDDNMTVPTLRGIMESAIIINGLQDFFGKAFGGTLKVDTLSNPTPTIPPEKDGSIISSDSAMAGGPKT